MVAAISFKGLIGGEGFSVGAGGSLGRFCDGCWFFSFEMCLGIWDFAEGDWVVAVAISDWFGEV